MFSLNEGGVKAVVLGIEISDTEIKDVFEGNCKGLTFFCKTKPNKTKPMMIQIVDRENMTPIGQDRETLTFKAKLYLNVAVHMQVCRLFCVVYMPLFGLVKARSWFQSSM